MHFSLELAFFYTRVLVIEKLLMQLEHDYFVDLMKLQLLVFDHCLVLLELNFHFFVELVEHILNACKVHVTFREELLQNTRLSNFVYEFKSGSNFVRVLLFVEALHFGEVLFFFWNDLLICKNNLVS
jgi:hypothetical protein